MDEACTRGTAPVFIVGCPRSGTTWLYHTLLSAGGFAIYRSESKLYSFAAAFGGFRGRGQRVRFVEAWTASEYFARSGLDAERWRAGAADRFSSAGELLQLFMDEIRATQGASRWAECTPDSALYVERIAADFPDALFVHLVRDPRDVAASLARQPFVRPFPQHRGFPEVAAAGYWSWVERRLAAAGRRLPGRILRIHYEDLVGDPGGALTRLGGFIQHPLDGERIARRAIGSVGRPNSSFGGEAGGEAVQSVGRWRGLYPDDRLARIERASMPAMLAYADRYPPAAARDGRAALAGHCYRLNFALRFALREETPLGRWSDPGLGGLAEDPDRADRSLRPAEHLAYVRRLVQGKDG